MLVRTFRAAGAVPSRSRKGQHGQILAIFALFLIVLLGFTALAVDYGTYLMARRDYQNTADAAALAGSVYLTRPISNAKQQQARRAAWQYLRNELSISGPGNPAVGTGATPYAEGGWSIWVDTPASAGGSAYLGSAALTRGLSVFVRIERDNPAFLSRTFGFTGRIIRAWATAGAQPSRWAVLALCPYGDPTCPPTARDVTLNGTNTILKVVGGDVGNNWGFKANGATQLQLVGDSNAYFEDVTCGPSLFECYPSAYNVNDGSGNPVLVRTLPAPVEDPGYPLPAWLGDATTAVPARPDVTVPNGTGNVTDPTGQSVSCAGSYVRIGPGRYNSIDVRANSCVVLDPTFGLTSGQQPGIYVITGELTIGNSSFVIGDGVTLFFEAGMRPFNPTGGIVINNGNSPVSGVGAPKYGAWTTRGESAWSPASAGSPATTTYTAPTQGMGIAFYVLKPASGVTQVFNMSGTSPLMFQGVLYGPRDKVGVAGSGVQAAVGQLVGWTITYSGNTTITQIYDGPADSKSYLLEPRTGQGD